MVKFYIFIVRNFNYDISSPKLKRSLIKIVIVPHFVNFFADYSENLGKIREQFFDNILVREIVKMIN